MFKYKLSVSLLMYNVACNVGVGINGTRLFVTGYERGSAVRQPLRNKKFIGNNQASH